MLESVLSMCVGAVLCGPVGPCARAMTPCALDKPVWSEVVAQTRAAAPDRQRAVEAVEWPAGGRSRSVDRYADLIYRLLVGEVAGRSGDIATAMAQLSSAAFATEDPAVAKRAMQVAIYGEDRRAALRNARRWYALAPQDNEALMHVVLLELRNGDEAEAARLLRVLLDRLATDGSQQHYDVVVALLARETAFAAAAVRVMRRVVEQTPQAAEAHLALARLALGFKLYEPARQSAMRALALRPGDRRAIVVQAEAMQRQGDAAGGIALLGQAVANDPDDNDLRMTYARQLLRADRLAEARTQFGYLVERLPDDADVLYALGVLARQAQADDEAQGFFMRLIELDKRRSEAAYQLAEIAVDAAAWQAAIRWYRAVKTGDLATEAALQIGAVRARMGDLPAAREHLRAVRERFSDAAPRSYLLEATLLRDAGEAAAAMAVLDTAIGRYPDHLGLLYARALHGLGMGRLAVLERDLRAILVLDEDNVDALNALGYTLTDLTDRHKEALGYIRRALRLKPEAPEILDSMGWVHYRLGNLIEAERYLRRAFAADTDAEIAAHLGEVLWQRGECEAAERIWDAALATAPDHRVLQDTVRRFKADDRPC